MEGMHVGSPFGRGMRAHIAQISPPRARPPALATNPSNPPPLPRAGRRPSRPRCTASSSSHVRCFRVASGRPGRACPPRARGARRPPQAHCGVGRVSVACGGWLSAPRRGWQQPARRRDGLDMGATCAAWRALGRRSAPPLTPAARSRAPSPTPARSRGARRRGRRRHGRGARDTHGRCGWVVAHRPRGCCGQRSSET